ncbi:hypothetical protein HMPREF0044_0876 [Gleimia coleocanis DSM 15436]|uniref:Uncharacterized protein n=1 Tax=Gleimia coleocanis DSM 15436 TaxID=525245 RepID=C0VZZ8_9ACTO|nr:hypothetical protein [Gleimia coleocanis]EEH63857.1 hypothetical protein HMPREF0044_0876 [Gleimia coleocanis DSM 15436]
MTTNNLSGAVLKLGKLLPMVAAGVLGVSLPVAWLFEKSVVSALVGGGVGLILAFVTATTLRYGVKKRDFQAAFIGIDYLLKAILLIGTLLIAKHVVGLDNRIVALVLVLSILLQSFVQVRALTNLSGPVVEPIRDAHNVANESE